MEFSKKEMMEEALERVVSKTNLPGSFFLKLMRDLKAAYEQHQRDVVEWKMLLDSSKGDIERVIAEASATTTEMKQAHGQNIDSFNAVIQQASDILNEKTSAVEEAVARAREAKGEPGKDGTTPVRGKDYYTKKDEDTILARVLGRIQRPKDGETPVIDTAAILDELIEKLKTGEVLTKEHIGGLEAEITSYRSQLAGSHYGTDTWARGGGDTVGAGANVTISTIGGVKVISASGGGAASPSTPTGTVDGVNTVFGVSAQPGSVVSDGITYFLGAGYSYSAPNITMDVPPSQYIRYYV